MLEEFYEVTRIACDEAKNEASVVHLILRNILSVPASVDQIQPEASKALAG
jgi:hypothetical protein